MPNNGRTSVAVVDDDPGVIARNLRSYGRFFICLPTPRVALCKKAKPPLAL